MSSRESRISEVLNSALRPTHFLIDNESHQHAGSQSETHYKVLIVSSVFVGKSRLDRQRVVNDLLKQEFESGLHALTQKTLTPEEWALQKDQFVFESPACAGKKA